MCYQIRSVLYMCRSGGQTMCFPLFLAFYRKQTPEERHLPPIRYLWRTNHILYKTMAKNLRVICVYMDMYMHIVCKWSHEHGKWSFIHTSRSTWVTWGQTGLMCMERRVREEIQKSYKEKDCGRKQNHLYLVSLYWVCQKVRSGIL